MKQWFSKWSALRSPVRRSKPRRSFKPAVESLEDRCVPAVIQVGPGDAYTTIAQAAAVAQNGDTVEIQAATYTSQEAIFHQSNLTIEGVGGTPVFNDNGYVIQNQKGILDIRGNNVTVKNIEFEYAHDTTGASKNYCGVRGEGNTLTIQNCSFFHNDDGILINNDSNFTTDNNSLLVSNSEFGYNGYGDGYSHNMYIGEISSFTLEYSYSHDANQGHLVKSRALSTHLLYNYLADGSTGGGSSEVDIPYGGNAYLVGNVIEKDANALNDNFITFNVENGPSSYAQQLYLVNNTFVNNVGKGTYVFDNSSNPPSAMLLENNIFAGGGILSNLSYTNVTNLVTSSPGFVNWSKGTYLAQDYMLAAGSPAIDAGTQPSSANGFSLVPTSEYVDSLSSQPRPANDTIDIGAYEYAPIISPPPAPTNLTATASNAQVALTWTASSGATSYDIYRGTTSGGETLLTTGITSTSFTNTGLTNGTTYYYEVSAVNAGGQSGKSNQVSATPQVAPPAAPTNLAVTAGNAQVALTWTASTGATSYDIYRGTTSGGETLVHSSITATSFTDTGLTNGDNYYYEVTAVNAGGQSGRSNEATAWPQAPGGTIWVEDATPIGASLASDGGDGWTWSSSNPAPYSGSQDQQSNAASGEHQHYFYNAGQTLTVTSGGTLYAYVYLNPSNPPQEAMLQWNVNGSWEHRAYWGANDIGWGSNGTVSRQYIDALPATGGWVRLAVPASAVGLDGATVSGMAFTLYGGQANWDQAGTVSATMPPAPTGLTATPGNGQVSLTWTASTGAASYDLYRGTSSGGETLVDSGITAASFTDTGLTNGTTYYYEVTAVNGAGQSGYSNQVSATPQVAAPAAPTNLAAAAGNAQVALTWTASSGASSYDIYRGTTSGGETLLKTAIAGTSFTDTGLSNGTTYYYEVSAVNAGGQSGKSNQVSATPQVAPPAAPTNLVAIAGNAQVALTWTASSGAASYDIYRGTSSGGETLLAAGIASTSFTNTGLSNGTTYYYEVSAVNAGGQSGKSNQVSATPQVPPPAAPTNLVATAGNAQVALTWTASSGAASYDIYRGTSSGGETVLITGITSTSFTNTGLTNGTTYYYEVSAVNNGGQSGKSNQASATPQLPPPLFSSPINVSAGSEPDSIATLRLDNGTELVLVANFGSNNVSVLESNGNGTFAALATLATGSGPNGFAVGNFGNGHQDFAVGNYYSNTVSVFLGDGSGNFTAGPTLSTGSGPANEMAIGDFTGNGVLDLATANQNAGTVSIFMGNGNGTFQKAVNYSVGAGVDAIAPGDFRGNGQTDLAVANYNTSTVTVLLNQGNGTFAAGRPIAVGAKPWYIAAGDFNATAKDSIATANLGGNNVSVLLSNGDGTFQTAVNYATGANPTGVVAADLNGDGKIDLATSNYGGNNASVLLGNGNGTFQQAQNFATGSGPNGIALGDLTNNGKLDLAVADQNGNAASILMNQSVQFQLLSGVPIANSTAANLTMQQLAPVEAQAFAAWEATGALSAAQDAALHDVQFVIANLPGGVLGETVGHTITIDSNAAGYGWSLGSRVIPTEVDLRTVVEHELGHVLGLADLAPGTHPGDLMDETLGVGMRRSPSAYDICLLQTAPDLAAASYLAEELNHRAARLA